MDDNSTLRILKRVSRACVRCRSRKSRCNLDAVGSPGTPPCERCIRDKQECVLATSNRGGRRVRRSKISPAIPSDSGTSPIASLTPSSTTNQVSVRDVAPRSDHISNLAHLVSHESGQNTDNQEQDSGSDTDDPITQTNLQNPSDAWQFLRNVAKGTSPDRGDTRRNLTTADSLGSEAVDALTSYRLIQDGSLSIVRVRSLIAKFAECYHPYLPLVPRRLLEPDSLHEFVKEPHLLTAVLTIASKDLHDFPDIHLACASYMHHLIGQINAGKECDVEAVEALLLISEWEPSGLRDSVGLPTDDVGKGEEDRASWMHVGLALRSGYFLGIDQTSFRDLTDGADLSQNRRRLTWACAYIADRLVSCRVGRAFWSRGPGPPTEFSGPDFPSLQPILPGDEDYASIFQATLDLTFLFSNVHDVLYSGMSTSRFMALIGEYVKYIDQFRASISRWNRVWGTLTCSPKLKATLQMSYEYLRLYTNAFSFQATISRAILSKSNGGTRSSRDQVKAAFSDVGSMPDARFIFESVDAAKQYLTILNNFVDPETCLRYLPVRYYLCSIYCAVFLYKARSCGVISTEEEAGVRKMVQESINRLRRASVKPGDLGSRYARLLELLWGGRAARGRNDRHAEGSEQQNLQLLSESTPASFVGSEATNNFSWLDLSAVGDFVSGADQMPLPDMYIQNNAQGHPAGFGAQTTWDDQMWPTGLEGTYLF